MLTPLQRVQKVMDKANAIGWVFLVGVLLSQIKPAHSLGRGSRFRRSLLQDLSLCALIQILALCIVDSEIDLIIVNYQLRLASNDVNLDALDPFSFKAIQRLKQNSGSFLISILKTSVGALSDRRAVQAKIPADLENIEPDKPEFDNCVNNPEIDLVKGGKVMPLRDDILCIANKPPFDESIATKNKKLIFIISFYILSHS